MVVTEQQRAELFRSLVHCEPEEVLDTATVLPELRRQAENSPGWIMPFGKHKGTGLRQVPAGYLRWATGIEAESKGFRYFQRRAQEELSRRRR